MILRDGILRLDGGGSIPWGEVKMTDMEQILAQNERNVDKGQLVTEEWALEDIKRRAEIKDPKLDVAVNFFRGLYGKDPPGFEHVKRFRIPGLKKPQKLPPSVTEPDCSWLDDNPPF